MAGLPTLFYLFIIYFFSFLKLLKKKSGHLAAKKTSHIIEERDRIKHFITLYFFYYKETPTLAKNKEGKFQSDLKLELEQRLPGCIVQKMDPSYQIGFPDLMIFYGSKWAALECKKSLKDISHSMEAQPWQRNWVERLNTIGFSSYICPEIKEEILDAVQRYLDAR